MNTTLLTTLREEGMGASMAVEGATVKEVFEVYVEYSSWLPLCGRVVVMDSLGAHRPKMVRELIEVRGCELL
jgi:hypothetical protein